MQKIHLNKSDICEKALRQATKEHILTEYRKEYDFFAVIDYHVSCMFKHADKKNNIKQSKKESFYPILESMLRLDFLSNPVQSEACVELINNMFDLNLNDAQISFSSNSIEEEIEFDYYRDKKGVIIPDR